MVDADDAPAPNGGEDGDHAAPSATPDGGRGRVNERPAAAAAEATTATTATIAITAVPPAPVPPASAAGEFRCNNCGQVGHKAGDCPLPKMCGRCGATGHLARDCPMRAHKCEKCGEIGHTQVRCGMQALELRGHRDAARLDSGGGLRSWERGGRSNGPNGRSGEGRPPRGDSHFYPDESYMRSPPQERGGHYESRPPPAGWYGDHGPPGGGGPRSEFRCNNCGQVGHKAGDCPHPKQCGRCGTFAVDPGRTCARAD